MGDSKAATLPVDAAALVARAENSAARGDVEAAIDGWARLRAAFPNVADGYLHAAELLRQAGRLDEAEQIAALGMARIPDAAELSHQHALAALDRGDAADAASRWQRIVERFPDFADGHQFAMLALRLSDQIEAAEAIAQMAHVRFETEPGIWLEHTLLAVHREDWPETIARAEQMRALFSDIADGYRFGVLGLREAGREDEAEELGEAGLQAASYSAELHQEHALTAMHRGDLAAAVERWAAMREAFPDTLEGYRFGITTFRDAARDDDADVLAALAMERFPAEPEFWQDRALAALRREAWDEATQILESVRAAFPYSPEAYRFGIVALRESGRIEDAEDLGQIGKIRFPQSSDILHEHALTALAKGDYDDAIRRWEIMRSVFPEAPEGYRFGMLALREAGRSPEAEMLGETALQQMPDHAELWNEHALAAFQRGEMAEAARRWAAMRERFPDNLDAYVGNVAALRESARFDEAERQIRAADEVARAGLRQFPNNMELWREHAMTALHGREWIEAVRRFDELRARFPDNVEGYRFGAFALRQARDVERAEQVIKEGLQLFEGDPDLWIEYANNADHDNDAAEAAARWETMRERFPEREEGYTRGMIALLDAGQFEAADNLATASMTRFRTGEAMQLFMQFESLGDNCEFGLAQRHFGAEPIGLLRWSGILPDDLARALTTRFEGAGEPENVEVIVADNGNYMIADNSIGSVMNSFVDAQAMESEKFFALNCRRLRFLRDKLVADLAAAEKIFVYNPRTGDIEDEQIRAIHAGIRRYGGAKLLCIRTTDDSAADGKVDDLGDGLLIGTIGRTSRAPERLDLLYQSWLHICHSAAK